VPDGPTQPPLTERQWDALGALRRLQEQGQPAGRGAPGLHLATPKPLAAVGPLAAVRLVDLDETGEPDRKGRQWTAVLTHRPRRPGPGRRRTHLTARPPRRYRQAALPATATPAAGYRAGGAAAAIDCCLPGRCSSRALQAAYGTQHRPLACSPPLRLLRCAAPARLRDFTSARPRLPQGSPGEAAGTPAQGDVKGPG
jgi:hypothetical protein